jgi:hypothetical protein
MSGAVPLIPPMPSWRGPGKFTFDMVPAYVLVAAGSVNFSSL